MKCCLTLYFMFFDVRSCFSEVTIASPLFTVLILNFTLNELSIVYSAGLLIEGIWSLYVGVKKKNTSNKYLTFS